MKLNIGDYVLYKSEPFIVVEQIEEQNYDGSVECIAIYHNPDSKRKDLPCTELSPVICETKYEKGTDTFTAITTYEPKDKK